VDEILKAIITGAPSFLGLVFLSYVLMQQNAKLLDALLDFSRKCMESERSIDALDSSARSLSRSSTLTDSESDHSH